MRVRRILTSICVSWTVAACDPPVVPKNQDPERPAPTGHGGSTGFTGQSQPFEDVYTPTTGIQGTSKVAFYLPRGGTEPFLEHPWPSELARRQNGTIDFSHFPGQDHIIVEKYIEEAERSVRDFSISQTAYFRFEGDDEPNSVALPDYPADAMRKDSPIFLMDVDPTSPERGQFFPLDLRYYREALTYIPAKTIAAKPMLGFVLRPKTLYAYVVRRDLKDVKGKLLGTTTDLELIKWTSERLSTVEETARKLHKDTFDYLAKAPLEVKREDIAAIALFRTGAPYELSDKLLSHAIALSGPQAPRITDAAWDSLAYDDYFIVRGHYCTPNYQSDIDRAPFTQDGGGTLVLDAQGMPALQPIPAYYRNDGDPEDKDSDCTPLMKARFVMSVPKQDMPMTGWPILVSAHGTGGSAESFIGNNDIAGWAAKEGFVVVSTDQPLHGATNDPGRRPGSDKPVVFDFGGVPIAVPLGVTLTAQDMFYNPVNPGAARDNARQSMVDTAVLLRLIGNTDFATAMLPSTTIPLLAAFPSRTNPRFNTSKALLIGHSQGSQTLATQAALDAMVKGVVLSGCGGDIRYGILRRTKPFELRIVLQALLGTTALELDEMHPLMSLAQMMADGVDPQSYASLYRNPLSGRQPQNVLHFVGTNDSYNPRESGEALAIAMRSPQLEPSQGLIAGLSMLSIPLSAGPLVANNGPGATLAFIELTNVGNDGHFVMFDDPKASALVKQFIASMRDSGVASVGPY